MEVWVERRDQTLSSGHQRGLSPLPSRRYSIKATQNSRGESQSEPALPFDLLAAPVSAEKKATAIDLSSGGPKSQGSILARDNEMITINNSP